MKDCPGENRSNAEVKCAAAQQIFECLGVGLVPLEILNEGFLVLLDRQLCELLLPLDGLGLEGVVHQRLVIALVRQHAFKAIAHRLLLGIDTGHTVE